MIVNINARILTNNAVFVQYSENGKAKDAAFLSWADFITWFTKQIGE